MVDYINVVLKKHPSLINTLKSTEGLIGKMNDFEKISEFSIVHQGLILEIMTKLKPIIDLNTWQRMVHKAFSTC